LSAPNLVLIMLFKKPRHDRHVFEEERRIRVKRVSRAGDKEYYDFLISLPRPWIKRLLSQLGVKRPEDLRNVKVKIVYDGDVVIKAPA